MFGTSKSLTGILHTRLLPASSRPPSAKQLCVGTINMESAISGMGRGIDNCRTKAITRKTRNIRSTYNTAKEQVTISAIQVA